MNAMQEPVGVDKQDPIVSSLGGRGWSDLGAIAGFSSGATGPLTTLCWFIGGGSGGAVDD